jgi:hypothetical protein
VAVGANVAVAVRVGEAVSDGAAVDVSVAVGEAAIVGGAGVSLGEPGGRSVAVAGCPVVVGVSVGLAVGGAAVREAVRVGVNVGVWVGVSVGAGVVDAPPPGGRRVDVGPTVGRGDGVRVGASVLVGRRVDVGRSVEVGWVWALADCMAGAASASRAMHPAATIATPQRALRANANPFRCAVHAATARATTQISISRYNPIMEDITRIANVPVAPRSNS